jgi:hypothetical protein
MAMVIAVRGKNVIKVSRKAYETMFKKRGYRILDEKPEQDRLNVDFEEESEEQEEEQEQEEHEQEIETIPISEMNKEQLAEYAKEHNIDTSGARNVREARQIIQKAIREAKM